MFFFHINLHTMTKQNRFLEFLLSTLLKQQLQPSFLGEATSLAHMYLGSFSHSSLQIISSSVRLDGEHCCTAIFRSLQRCSISFKSGLWLGHSRTFRDLSRSHSYIVLAVWLGSLSCWKVNLCPSLCSKLLPCKNDGGHCVLGDLQCFQKCFGTLPQICASTQSCLRALRTIPSTSWLGFFSDMHCGHYVDRWVPFQIMSNQLNLPQVDSKL